MLMKNNFVHADCHGGNILISSEERDYNFFTEVWDYLKDVWYIAEFRIKAETLSEERTRQVYLEYCKEEL
jgi:predicted unusual protein kinase regulating ubiquinone biosynthesis (AarF/ABC1/UbiB family)